jgi:chaperonin GroEL
LLHDTASGGVGLARDGLTIAQEMADTEGARSIGPRILKETLFAAHRDLGDGTARLACILGAMLQEGQKLVAAGHPPGLLANEILRLGRVAEGFLAGEVCATPSLPLIASAATTDSEIAEAVADAVSRVGGHGVIEVKEHWRQGVAIETGKGFTLDATLVSERLNPDPPATTLELEDVFILVVDDIVSEFGRLAPILEGFASRHKALAIVARDVTGSALDAIVRNRRELGLRVAAFKPTDVSTRAGRVLEDLAIATAATLISVELGTTLDSARPSMLGRARRMRFGKGRALFAAPAGEREAVDRHRAQLIVEAERVKYLAYDREHLLRRAARLAGAWGEVSVGGRTKHETSVRLDEARAALATVQAALASGVVAGGGSALVRVAEAIRRGDGNQSAIDVAARRCVARGLEAVASQIARNAGRNPNESLAQLRASHAQNLGIDARSGAMCDVVSEGIVDPLSIARGVVERAASAAATMLRVEALVCR